MSSINESADNEVVITMDQLQSQYNDKLSIYQKTSKELETFKNNELSFLKNAYESLIQLDLAKICSWPS